MTLKVIAKEELMDRTKVFFLNLTEPKPFQLYMMVVDNFSVSLDLLTVYNPKTNTYEDVTGLFHHSLLQSIALEIRSTSCLPFTSISHINHLEIFPPHSS